ncbi:MAG TPA: SPOR domain-containing protein [Nakamurella sp.]
MGDEIGQHTAFYYNITTKQVEREGESKAKDLLGPFPTAEEAANALEIIRQREERKSAEDREWRDG